MDEYAPAIFGLALIFCAIVVLGVVLWRETAASSGHKGRLGEESPFESGCRYCGMEYGYHDEKCPQRDLTHLADAPSPTGDDASKP